MRTSSTSWPPSARPARTDSAEASDTSCSLERPPREDRDPHGGGSGVRRRLEVDRSSSSSTPTMIITWPPSSTSTAGAGPLVDRPRRPAPGRSTVRSRSTGVEARAARAALRRRPARARSRSARSTCSAPVETVIVTVAPRSTLRARRPGLCAITSPSGSSDSSSCTGRAEALVAQPRLRRVARQPDHVGHGHLLGTVAHEQPHTRAALDLRRPRAARFGSRCPCAPRPRTRGRA